MINNVDELKGKISLLDLVNENVVTKRRGQNYVGLCPFHNENTPSFSVDAEQNLFYCFGCQESGDAIAYYQKFHNLDFVETAEILAERYGVNLERTQTEKQKAFMSKQEKAYKLVGEVNRQFREQLDKGTIDYLKARKIEDRTIKNFELGYCKSLNITDKESAKELGLMNGNKLVYQDRLIIPIHNKKGLAIAFNARTLTDRMPKYIHSPNNCLWQKKEILFGFDKAIPLIKEQNKVYIVEGCFDVMAGWQKGIPTVACLGSSIATKQITELLKLTDNIIFCLDGDKAGQKAIYKMIESLETEVFSGVYSPKILLLPSKDMADYFMENGKKDFDLLKAIDWVEWLFLYYKKTESNPFSYIIRLIARFSSLAEKQKYIELASEILEGDKKYLQRELSRSLHKPLTEKIKIEQKKEVLSFEEIQIKFREKQKRKAEYVKKRADKGDT